MGAIPKEDLLLFGDGCCPVVVHQLIQGRELLGPQEVTALGVSHDFEVLNIVLVPGDQANSSRMLHGDLAPAGGSVCTQGW